MCADPLVANVAFEAFSCYEFDSNSTRTRRYLISDVSIECSTVNKRSEEYEQVLTLAWAAIIIYPIGGELSVSQRLLASPPHTMPSL